MYSSGLVLERWANNFGGSSAPIQDVSNVKSEGFLLPGAAEYGIEALLAQSVDHPPDVSPIDCAGTHRTRLAAGVHCEILKLGPVRFSTEHAHEVCFGMSGDVVLGHHRILCFQQDLALVVGEYGSERIIAGCRGAQRDLKGSSEQFFIPRGKLVSHFGRDQLYTISYRWNDAVWLPTRDKAS